MKSLGQAGEIEPETEGILTEYGVDFSEFSNQVLQCLPPNLPWSIPQDEFERRKDLRLVDVILSTINGTPGKDENWQQCKKNF